MALLTKFLKLIKPDASENYSVDVWNKNSDAIDDAIEKRVVKNADITPGKATKVTYDAKGLVTGGEDLTPDDIPPLDFSKIATGAAPVLFADGKPLYGSRFVDIDKDGNVTLRPDGKGSWLISVTEDGTPLITRVVTPIADNLTTEDGDTALSAKQGTILSRLIEALRTLVNSHRSDFENHVADKDNPHGLTAAKINLGNVDNTADTDKPISKAVAEALALKATVAELSAHINDTNNGHKVTKAQVGLGNVDNTADADKNVATAEKLKTAHKINGVAFDGSKDITIADATKIPTTEKGAAGGVAELDENGYVPSSQLPSYVDDAIEGTLSTFPRPGESGKIYVDTDTRVAYRWSGTDYVDISPSLALGETSSTAYPGNKGKQNATDIATLKATTAGHTTAIQTLEEESADQGDRLTAVEAEAKKLSDGKADLINGVVPDDQLPYRSESPTLYADGKPLYPVTFADLVDGKLVINENGDGEYLIACTPGGTVYARNMTNNVTDPVTGIVYRLDMVNNQPILTKL